jgi:hypothetical protein
MSNRANITVRLWLKVYKRKLALNGFLWKARNYCPPSPQNIKTRILSSHSLDNAIWIETGTYLGYTTLYLSKIAKSVISIEPQTELSDFAQKRLKRIKNIRIINSTSEESIATILENLSGPTCFWFDGHYSGDVTYKGSLISPIAHELDAVSAYKKRNTPIVVFIDDFRLFVGSSSSGYPSNSTLVDWASENELSWTVEHDIFIAKST